MVKRTILSILLGVVSFFVIDFILTSIPQLKFFDSPQGDFRLTIALLCSGMIAGYFAQRKGLLIGILIAILIWFLTIIFIVTFFIGPFIVNEHFSLQTILNTPFQGDPKDFLRQLIKAIMTTLFLGGLGGFIGERLFKLHSKNKMFNK